MVKLSIAIETVLREGCSLSAKEVYEMIERDGLWIQSKAKNKINSIIGEFSKLLKNKNTKYVYDKFTKKYKMKEKYVNEYKNKVILIEKSKKLRLLLSEIIKTEETINETEDEDEISMGMNEFFDNFKRPEDLIDSEEDENSQLINVLYNDSYIKSHINRLLGRVICIEVLFNLKEHVKNFSKIDFLNNKNYRSFESKKFGMKNFVFDTLRYPDYIYDTKEIFKKDFHVLGYSKEENEEYFVFGIENDQEDFDIIISKSKKHLINTKLSEFIQDLKEN